MSNNPFGSSGPITNNPFVDTQARANERFPAISTSDPSLASPTGYGAYSPYSGGMPPLTTGYGTYGMLPHMQPQPQPQPQPNLQFQPTGYFGGMQQQPFMPYGGQQFTPVQTSQQFSPAQTSHQAAPSHLQQFDPYASLGQLGQVPQQANFQQQAQQFPGGAAPSFQPLQGTPAIGSQGQGAHRSDDHPRAWIRLHKAELESWDAVSWRQAFNTFDALSAAWENRKSELQLRCDAVTRGILHAQEGTTWQNMLKEATSNIDTIAAAKVQMQEALAGYRHSSDLASKRRVKECLNAGLTSLPEWPQ